MPWAVLCRRYAAIHGRLAEIRGQTGRSLVSVRLVESVGSLRGLSRIRGLVAWLMVAALLSPRWGLSVCGFLTHGLRRGLCSVAATRLFSVPASRLFCVAASRLFSVPSFAAILCPQLRGYSLSRLRGYSMEGWSRGAA